MNLVSGSQGYLAPNLMEYIPDSIGYDIRESCLEDLLGVTRINTVYHLGALSGIKACEDDQIRAIKWNITELVNMITLFKHAKFIFTSSEAVEHPDNLYARTKLVGESLIIKAGGVVCRMSNVYGGDNYLEKKDTVIARLMKGTFEERHQDHTTRDFIHVTEACKGLIEASTLPSGVYSLNTGIRTPIGVLKVMSENPDFPSELIKPYKLTRIS